MREQIAKEERLTEQLQAGAITPRQWARRSDKSDLAEDDEAWQTTINGETVNYGDVPMWVAKRKLSALGATDPEGTGDGGTTDEDSDGGAADE
jgi:hypothetical protein